MFFMGKQGSRRVCVQSQEKAFLYRWCIIFVSSGLKFPVYKNSIRMFSKKCNSKKNALNVNVSRSGRSCNVCTKRHKLQIWLDPRPPPFLQGGFNFELLKGVSSASAFYQPLYEKDLKNKVAGEATTVYSHSINYNRKQLVTQTFHSVKCTYNWIKTISSDNYLNL